VRESRHWKTDRHGKIADCEEGGGQPASHGPAAPAGSSRARRHRVSRSVAGKFRTLFGTRRLRECQAPPFGATNC
jgi:hypothetical protein